MTTAAQRWAEDLAAWAIPPEILAQAPEDPWVLPPEMFTVGGDDPLTPSHERSREALPTGGTVLDVGCGGGRASVPLAPPARELVGVDERPVMLERFAAAAAGQGAEHREIVGRWPDAAGAAPVADVVVCHHVVYNVADLAPFLLALTDHATRRVVVELPWNHPLSHLAPYWVRFWQLERPTGPSAEDCLAVACEAGIDARLDVWDDVLHETRATLSPAQHAHVLRVRLCLPAEREPEVAAMLAEQPARPRRSATLWWDA
jgi:SAM-dependent methyltransferase